jgi:peptidoglycan/LPS O-acetylase OafA/YrhL
MEIRKLNTLRGIAAFIVVIEHYSHVTNFLGKALGHGAGQLGIILFFMLSGFLMSHLYIRREYTNKNIRAFAVARIARVVPLYLFVVVFSYYLYLLGIGAIYEIDSLSNLLSHLALLDCNSILWTIPVEIHYYVLFIIVWWIYSNNAMYSFLFMAVLYYATFAAGYPRFEGVFILHYDIRTLSYLQFFFVGVVFGHLYEKLSFSKSGVFVCALLIIPLLYPRIFSLIFNLHRGILNGFPILACMAFVFFVILFFVPDDNPILSNKVGDFLGKISYSVYLLHLPVVLALKQPAREMPWVFLLVCLALVIIISAVSYEFIEKPTRRAIRKRFSV